MAISIINCKNCNKSFEAKSKKACFCTPECRKEFNVKQSGEIGKNYVICQICKRAVASVTGIHMKTYHPGYTSEGYKKEFKGFPTIPASVSEKRTAGAKKSGAMMREPEHRKRLSESFKGENNPMHSSRVSKEFRLSISPFSPEFYKRKFPDLSEKECIDLAKKKSDSVEKKSWTQISYWTEKGFSEEEAKTKISSLQKTFSLDICIEKYGEEEGKKRWMERQKKWIAKVFNEETYIGGGKSFIGKTFNDSLNLLLEGKEYTILQGKDEKFIRCSQTKRAYKYDFTILDIKVIIEFNGDYWHCNPNIWKDSDFNKSKSKTAKEIWEYDEYKKRLAEKNGYRVLVVWEQDYRKDPKETLEKCLKFINETIQKNEETS
jgi:very-short-patch-repair endonuclease